MKIHRAKKLDGPTAKERRETTRDTQAREFEMASRGILSPERIAPEIRTATVSREKEKLSSLSTDLKDKKASYGSTADVRKEFDTIQSLKQTLKDQKQTTKKVSKQMGLDNTFSKRDPRPSASNVALKKETQAKVGTISAVNTASDSSKPAEVCKDCLSPTSDHRMKDGQLIHGRHSIGSKRIGNKEDHSTFSHSEGPRKITNSSAAAWSGGRSGSGVSVKNRNIDKKKNESLDETFPERRKIFRSGAYGADLNRKSRGQGGGRVHMDMNNIAAPEPDDYWSGVNPRADYADIKQKKANRPLRPMKKALNKDYKNMAIGENMKEDVLANDIIREAFTMGGRNNTTGGNEVGGKGQTARQMLSGEWFGSAAWPFDQATSNDFEGSTKLQQDQAVSGEGDMVTSRPKGKRSYESISDSLVNSLLEDSPSYIYTDINSVGYLINYVFECGYKEFAARLSDICEDAEISHVKEILAMVEKLEEDKVDEFITLKLTHLAKLITEGTEESNG